MTLNESASFVVSLIFSVLTVCTMQILRPHLISTQLMTIVGGFLGSILFVFLLTCLANLGRVALGKGYVTQWVEVVVALVGATLASASVHRVSATTAVLFSMGMLYTMSKMSQDTYGSHSGAPTNTVGSEKSKKRK